MPGKGHPVFVLVNMPVFAGDFREVLPRKLARIALWYNVRRKKLWYAEIEKTTPHKISQKKPADRPLPGNRQSTAEHRPEPAISTAMQPKKHTNA